MFNQKGTDDVDSPQRLWYNVDRCMISMTCMIYMIM